MWIHSASFGHVKRALIWQVTTASMQQNWNPLKEPAGLRVELQAALWQNRGLKEGAALPKGEGQRPPETTAGRKGFGNKARHSSRFHHISKFLIAERDEMTRAIVSNPETFNQPVPPARSSVMHSSQAHESFREERAQPAKQIRKAREKEDNT